MAREEGLTGVVEKTIESNVDAYPSAVERLVDVRNILLQNKHPFAGRFADDEDDDYDDDSGDGEDGGDPDNVS